MLFRSPAVERALFRIAQEGIENAAAQSGARAVIHLRRDGREVRLEIRVEGAGASEGVGVLAMRERAEQAGGKLTWGSDPLGTTALAVLPISQK